MATASSPFAGEVHADLVSESGVRIASLSASVNAKGLGFGDIAPLSGARAFGIKRPERVRVFAMLNHTVRISGAKGTSLILSDQSQGAMMSGYGKIAISPKASRTMHVNAKGAWETSAFHPAKGQTLLLLGKTSGPLRSALAARYHLTPFRSSHDSRDALINNPSRYRSIAGVIIGTGVSASQLAKLDLARSLFNEGRFVVTTGPRATGILDKHIYMLSHAHLGMHGAIIRREAVGIGHAVHSYPQIREPILTHSRVGATRTMSEAQTFSAAQIQSAAKAGLSHLATSLRAAERLAPPPRPAKRKGKHETQSSSSTSPATVTAGSDDAAYYTVPVNQYISVAATFSNCCGSAITQTMGITYNPIYTVSLAQSTSEVTQQAVTETNATQFNALATSSDVLAEGAFNSVSGVVTPTTWGDAAFGLSMAYHSVVMACAACKGTSGGTITPAFESGSSAPTQQVTQVSGGSSSGTSQSSSTSWDNSTSNTSDWSVSASVGMFGPVPTGSVSASYGQSTTTSTSTGGGTDNGTSLNSSINYTLSNWTTNPVQGATQAQYTTYSSTVIGATGTGANAAYSLPFNPYAITTNGGYVATPSQYLGNGPAPSCDNVSISCAAPVLNPQPYGSGENITGFTQGSTSFFTLDSSGNQLGTGSVSPWVADNFYLFGQGEEYPACPESVVVGQPTYCPPTVTGGYAELQVLGQSQVSIAANDVSGITSTAAATPSGSGGAGDITTYYNINGQVVNGASGAVYQTTGLDLCAPPVLTSALWNAGCDDDPNFTGPPAVYSAAPPSITTASTTNPIQTNGSTGQPEVAAPAPALTCNPGTWSGNPTYTYQWQQWNPTFGDWQNISGATSASYTPSSALTANSYFTCNVTATNSLGAVSALAESVEVIIG